MLRKCRKYHVVSPGKLIPMEVYVSATNAFQVTMNVQRMNTVCSHPVSVRNKHDQLYNDLLSFILSKNLKWKADEVHSGEVYRLLEVY